MFRVAIGVVACFGAFHAGTHINEIAQPRAGPVASFQFRQKAFDRFFQIDLSLVFENRERGQDNAFRDRHDDVQVVRLDGRVFFVNDFAGVHDETSVNRAIVDQLVERLFRSVRLLQFQSTDLRPNLHRQIENCAASANHR